MGSIDNRLLENQKRCIDALSGLGEDRKNATVDVHRWYSNASIEERDNLQDYSPEMYTLGMERVWAKVYQKLEKKYLRR